MTTWSWTMALVDEYDDLDLEQGILFSGAKQTSDCARAV